MGSPRWNILIKKYKNYITYLILIAAIVSRVLSLGQSDCLKMSMVARRHRKMPYDVARLNMTAPKSLAQKLSSRQKLVVLEFNFKSENCTKYQPSGNGALAHHMQYYNDCNAGKIQNGCQGSQKLPPGSGKWFNPRFLGTSFNFRWISFLIQGTVLWDKVVTEKMECNGGKEWLN